MQLVIRAVTLAGAPLTQALSACFDEHGGSIGRADDNTLSLPDPERHISRRQVEVWHGELGYTIRNVGSANAILLNDGPLPPGDAAPLADGDTLQIGAYRLEVGVPTNASSRTLPPRARLPEGFRFTAAPPPAHADETDVFAMLRPAGTAHADSIDRLIGERGSDALQRFLLDDHGDHGDHDSSAATSPAPRAPRAPSRTDPMQLLTPEPPPRRNSARAADLPDRTPAIHAPMPLPRPAPAAPPDASVDIEVDECTVPATLPAAAPDALWAAFCEGIGLALPPPPQGMSPEMARVVGQLLRHLVGGTVQLVRLRAETKCELHFPVTLLRTQGNNPLRYSPNVQAALTQLLQPPLPGYMAGPAAAQEAMDDLCAHAIGTMAGMRAALEGVLARFEPRRLEGQLNGGQVLDALVPMHRRARLWELFLQHFDAVRSEAKEDFDRLFGQAFVGAYEQQLDRLDAQRRAPRRTR